MECTIKHAHHFVIPVTILLLRVYSIIYISVYCEKAIALMSTNIVEGKVFVDELNVLAEAGEISVLDNYGEARENALAHIL